MGKMRTGDRWSGRDRYLWLHKEIIIPESWKGKRAVGIFDFGNTGAGNNSGFEAMCYIKRFQGLFTQTCSETAGCRIPSGKIMKTQPAPL